MSSATRKVKKMFPKEHPEKPWTSKKKYKKWVSRLTRKRAASRNSKKVDMCVGKRNICGDDLGIPRRYMPQFRSADDVRKFTKFIRKAYDIKSARTTRKVSQLTPSQSEISRKRIISLITEPHNILKKIQVPLVISKDNFIVDGHHRWAAYRLKRPKASLPVIAINAPVKDILGIAVAWGAKHEEF